MVDLTGPAATRLRRSGVACGPKAFLQCDSRAERLRRCRCRIWRLSLHRGERAVCETTQKTRRTSSTVISGYFFPQPVSLKSQPVMRQERQCRMAMPPQPGSRLVVAQPGFILALPVALLDGPTREARSKELLDRGIRGGIAQKVLRLDVLVQRVRNEKPLFTTCGSLSPMSHHAQEG